MRINVALLATIGLAAVFYFAYASFFVLRQACPVCLTMYVSVIGIFVIAARSKTPLATLPSRLAQDLSALGRSTTAVALTMAWLAASLTLVLWFPRDQVVAAAEAPAPAAPTTWTCSEGSIGREARAAASLAL